MKAVIGGIIAALVLGAGAAAGGWFIGNGFYAARYGDRFVSVKGLAEQHVKADLAIWPVRFVASGNQLDQVQATIRKEAVTVTSFLESQGIAAADIRLESLEVTDRDAQLYGGNNKGDRFIIRQTLMVRSHAVDKVASAGQQVGKLVDAGVILDSNGGNGAGGPSYSYTQLNQIKPAMIAAATKAARAAAEQFAKDSGASLGGIRRADQGVFQILARDNAPGVNARQQVAKTVRVVSHVQYYLQH